MAWSRTTSARTREMPADWPDIRRAVLERDGYGCTLQIPDRCTGRATQVDHAGDRLDHRPSQLRAACQPCHAARTAAQGHDAMRERRSTAQHPVETHPARQRRA